MSVLTQAVEETEMPLPANPQTFFQGGLFILAGLAALYVASAIILPVVLAFILMLLLQPAVRLLERVHLPRTLRGTFGDPARRWNARRSRGSLIPPRSDMGGEAAARHTASRGTSGRFETADPGRASFDPAGGAGHRYSWEIRVSP